MLNFVTPTPFNRSGTLLACWNTGSRFSEELLFILATLLILGLCNCSLSFYLAFFWSLTGKHWGQIAWVDRLFKKKKQQKKKFSSTAVPSTFYPSFLSGLRNAAQYSLSRDMILLVGKMATDCEYIHHVA